jgi:Uri superfamily endonuclease
MPPDKRNPDDAAAGGDVDLAQFIGSPIIGSRAVGWNSRLPALSPVTSAPGTYVLLLQAKTATAIQVGRWGNLQTRRGWYLYVGSAFGPGGIRARVARHCRTEKSLRWHIDYLRQVTQLDTAWCHQGPERHEHSWAAALMTLPGAQAVTGFGCSDCRCTSHLAYFGRRPDLHVFRERTGASIAAIRCPDLTQTLR